MFLCRNCSEIQIFSGSFQCVSVVPDVLLELPEMFSLDWQQRENEWAGILMDVEVFSSVLCLLRIPPATSFKVGSCRQILAPEAGIGHSKKVNGVCPSITGVIFMYLFRYWNHSKPSFTVSLFHGIKTKVKNPTKTCVIHPADLWIFEIPEVQVGFSVVFRFFKLFLFYPSVQVAVSRSKWKTFRNSFIRRIEYDVVDV